MSGNPATPEKIIEGLSQGVSIQQSVEHQESSTRLEHQGSLHEPSPASTCGATTADDSLPATPLQVQGNDSTTSIRDSLKLLRLNPGTTSSSNEDSPNAIVDVSHPVYGLSRDLISTEHVHSSTMEEKRGDHTPIACIQSITHLSPRLMDGSALKSVKPEHSPSGFVVHGKDSKVEDPFSSPSRHQQIQGHDRDDRSPNLVARDTPSRTVDDHPIENQTEVASSPRADRLGQEISADNAQAILPPSACVFVANLSSVRSDEQLEHSVTQAFQSFGKVYVKIRRDNRGMPYAFCQYETKASADMAVDHGKNKLIDGRRCRTERAKVNRHLYMSKLSGDPIEEHEARAQLEHFGAIEALWYPTKTDTVMYQLPKGIWIQFAYFQDCRDAQTTFRDDQVFRLEQPPMPPDLRSRPLRSSAANSPLNRPSPSRTGYTPQHALAKKGADECCIFVGDLSPNVTQKQLGDLFGAYGRVLSMDLISKPSGNGVDPNVFAFIEFAIPEEAGLAVEALNHNVFQGSRIRVERKELNESVTRRPYPLAHRGDITFTSGSPNNRHSPQTNVSPSFDRGAAYQRLYEQAMQYGTPQMTAADILAAGRRQTSVANNSPTSAQQAPMYPILMPYPYYNPPYSASTTGPPSSQFANYNLGPMDDDAVPGLSPSGPTFSQGGISHGGYYPQVHGQSQSLSSGGPQSQTEQGTSPHQPTQQQYLNQQPMGQFQYAHGAMAYSQYQPSYYHYPNPHNGSGAPVLQYVYHPGEDPSLSVGSSGTTTIHGMEASESR